MTAILQYAAPAYSPHHQETAHVTSLSGLFRRLNLPGLLGTQHMQPNAKDDHPTSDAEGANSNRKHLEQEVPEHGAYGQGHKRRNRRALGHLAALLSGIALGPGDKERRRAKGIHNKEHGREGHQRKLEQCCSVPHGFLHSSVAWRGGA